MMSWCSMMMMMLDVPYSANACWGFEKGVGQTFFDITTLHGLGFGMDANYGNDVRGSIIEVDYYHAASLRLGSQVPSAIVGEFSLVSYSSTSILK